MRKSILIIVLAIVGICCKDDSEPKLTPPQVTTVTPTIVSISSVLTGGEVVYGKSDKVVERGVCYNTSPNPTISNKVIKSGSGSGVFQSDVGSLLATQYYFRAFAKIEGQVFYGDEKVTNLALLVPTFVSTPDVRILNQALNISSKITYNLPEAPITEAGFCWGLNNLPTVQNNKRVLVPTENTIQTTIEGLDAWKTHFIRAYAITNKGTFYGEQVVRVSIAEAEIGSVTDIDGNNYKTVSINNKVWMAENLKVTHFNDGTMVKAIYSGDEWKNSIESALTDYDFNVNNSGQYGHLYNGKVIQSSKNVCMEGWHIPSATEWQQLGSALGGLDRAGGHMKSTEVWIMPNNFATNYSGFTGLPGGSYCRVCLGNAGTFADLGTDGYWWCNDAQTFYYLTNDVETLRTKSIANVNDGLSIRCVKD